MIVYFTTDHLVVSLHPRAMDEDQIRKEKIMQTNSVQRIKLWVTAFGAILVLISVLFEANAVTTWLASASYYVAHDGNENLIMNVAGTIVGSLASYLPWMDSINRPKAARVIMTAHGTLACITSLVLAFLVAGQKALDPSFVAEGWKVFGLIVIILCFGAFSMFIGLSHRKPVTL